MSDLGEQPPAEPTASTPPPPPPAGPPVYAYYPQGYPVAYPPPNYYAPPNPYGYPRDHPQAGLALGLGLGAIIGGFVTLGLAFGLGPFAWYIGHKARVEVRNSNGAYHAEGNATAGMILGIVSTVFLALAILIWVLVIVGAAQDSSSGGTSALVVLRASS